MEIALSIYLKPRKGTSTSSIVETWIDKRIQRARLRVEPGQSATWDEVTNEKLIIENNSDVSSVVNLFIL